MDLLVHALKTQMPIPFDQKILFYVPCHDGNGCHKRAWVSCHNQPSAGCLLMKNSNNFTSLQCRETVKSDVMLRAVR